jgi:hypothetical protein
MERRGIRLRPARVSMDVRCIIGLLLEEREGQGSSAITIFLPHLSSPLTRIINATPSACNVVPVNVIGRRF